MNTNPSSSTVLVVDDSPETLALINDLLEAAGLTCLVAIDPKQGLHIAQKMQPDLILLDGLMPNMSGFEFCQACKIQPELRSIPIIFMTGLSDSESIVKAFAAGGVDYVTKPIDTQALVARIRVHLATANIIRGTQLALDKAGQHVFAVDSNGKLRWQTPQVQEQLEKFNQNQWLSNHFWPAVEHWIGQQNQLGIQQNSLNLHAGTKSVQLECLTSGFKKSTDVSDELLIRLLTSDDGEDSQRLIDKFGLSQREAEVLVWLARGKTNREMGHILGISPRTINKHLEQVFKKLEVDNRTNAAAKVIPLLQR